MERFQLFEARPLGRASFYAVGPAIMPASRLSSRLLFTSSARSLTRAP